jgi:peptidoglycan/LPS O-acetylase OafA/YrhL
VSFVSTDPDLWRIVVPMATPASTRNERPNHSDQRAQPPIRWPHPDATTLVLVGLWAVGLVVALLLPAAFVSPTEKNPATGDVILAFGTTLLGAAVMIGVAAVLWRRVKDASVLVMGLVPAVAVVAGGVILSATKIGSL